MSDGGSSGGGTSTTTSVQNLTPEQKSLIGLTVPTFKSYFDSQGKPTVAPYTGATVVPQNQLQQQGQQMVLTAANGSVKDATEAALKGTNFLTSGAALNPASNPGLQGTLDAASRRITDTLGQQVLPQIRSDSILAGGYGGNRQGIAEGLAGKAAVQEVGDTSAKLLNENYQSGLDAMTRALGFAPSNIQAGFTPGTAVSGVGDVQQTQQQKQMNDLISQYYNKTFFPLSLAEEIAGVAFGMPGGSASSYSSQGNAGGPSSLNNIMSGVAGGASIAASLLPYLMQ
jgi:hypothetical protein